MIYTHFHFGSEHDWATRAVTVWGREDYPVREQLAGIIAQLEATPKGRRAVCLVNCPKTPDTLIAWGDELRAIPADLVDVVLSQYEPDTKKYPEKAPAVAAMVRRAKWQNWRRRPTCSTYMGASVLGGPVCVDCYLKHENGRTSEKIIDDMEERIRLAGGNPLTHSVIVELPGRRPPPSDVQEWEWTIRELWRLGVRQYEIFSDGSGEIVEDTTGRDWQRTCKILTDLGRERFGIAAKVFRELFGGG